MQDLRKTVQNGEYVIYICRKGGVIMSVSNQELRTILTNEEYTVYTAYCVRGCKLWEIVDDTGLTINQVLNRIKTARRKIIAAYNVKGVEK